MHPIFTRWLTAVSIVLLCAANIQAQNISTYAGGIGDDSSATVYGRLNFNTGSGTLYGAMAIDPAGNVYINDQGRIRLINHTTGIISTIGLGSSTWMLYDATGNLYESSGNRVIKISTSGVTTTIAGTGTSGFTGDGSLATNATLSNPAGIALDASGNIYIVDEGNNRIRKVDPSGIINTIVGGGTLLGDGGPAISANLSFFFLGNGPVGIAVDAAGNVYIPDEGNKRIRKVTAGIISTIAGTGSGGASGFGGPATAAPVGTPVDIKVDAVGNVFFSTTVGVGSIGYVCKINASGILSKVAGNGTAGFSGDGGPASAAALNTPGNIFVDGTGNIFIVDAGNNRIREINPSGIINTIAGNGIAITGYSGDGGYALFGVFAGTSLSSDMAGNLYTIQGSQVRKINSATRIVSTIAGNGIVGFAGDGGLATAAELDAPTGVAIDRLGNLYIADNGTSHVRKISTGGIITTIAGGGSGGLGDGGPATAAVLSVNGVAVDSSFNVYISDATHHRIRKIDAGTGIINTIAGTGTSGTTGLGGPATVALIANPGSIAVDRWGTIYFADGSAVRKIDTFGTITAVPTLTGSLITVDRTGNVYAASASALARSDIYGYYSIIAGGGTTVFTENDGPATGAQLSNSGGIGIDTAGNVYLLGSGGTYVSKICCINTTVDHPPVYTHGAAQTMTVCASSGPTSIDTFLTATDLNIGDPETWSITTTPLHGTLAGGFPYSTVSTGTMTPSGLTYMPTAGYSGTDNFKIRIGDGTDTALTTITVTVSALVNPGVISGPATGCVGSSTTLNESVTGGTWSSSNTSIAIIGSTGSLTSVATGIDTISYTKTSTCGSASATYTVTVNPAPAGITGATSNVCVLASITLSDATPGGTWTSSNGTLATVGSVSGAVTGASAGTPTITYILPTGCKATLPVIVNALPSAGTITGPTVVCEATQVTLNDATSGGSWNSSNSSASVSGNIVTGVSAGTSTISYTVTNGCGTATTTHAVTINPLPFAGIITGPSAVCVGSLITLSDAVPGGTWVTVDPYVVLSSTAGVIAGLAGGTATISYLVTNSCGTATATTTVVVSSTPNAGIITGNSSICTGGIATLSNVVTGGTWSNANTFVATIDNNGVVTGVATGSAVVSYSVSNLCSSASTITIVNVTAATAIDPITGPSSVCTGLTIPLNDGSGAGVWSSSNTTVAVVSSIGVVSGITAGVTAIRYTASLGCGVSIAAANITVNSAVTAGTISGGSTLCTNATALLTDYIPGGVWSNNTGHASISPTGIVTGTSTGSDVITYAVTNGCGTASTTFNINIFPAPVAGAIAGPSNVCAGGSVSLSDNTLGGAWSSSSTSVAIVGNTGNVSGIAGGNVVISYTTTTGCGDATATQNVSVNVPFAGFVTGVTTLCVGGTSNLNDATTGGVWSSTASSVAIVSTSGTVTAQAAGTTIISYTVSGVCGTAAATAILTVGTLPIVSPITGTTNICTNAVTTLADATIGGVWSSNNPLIATINSSGHVTGLSAGTATISYMVTAGCGTDGSTSIVTVTAPPNAGIISGGSNVCVGSNITLNETAPGGIWSCGNSTVAAIGSTGVVNGIAAGNAVVTYTVSDICGTVATTNGLTVNPLPSAGIINGITAICLGSSASLSDVVTGGRWSSDNTTIAMIGSISGVVTSINTGSFNVSYTVSNGCGTAVTTQPVAINPLPDADTISGPSNVCAGANIILSDIAIGGTWTSSAPAIAGVNSSGIVTAITGGSAVILYSVANSCGTSVATKGVTVNIPTAGTITGVTSVCAGDTTQLFNAIYGGIWSSSNTAVATINSSGAVSGIAGGTTIISYSVSDACGTATVTSLYTVGSLPNVSAITGASVICYNASTHLADGTAGGIWSSDNTAIANVNNTGLVTGVSAGTVTISYMVTAGCGTSGASMSMHLDTTPSAGTISGASPLCDGLATTLSASDTGGSWSSSNEGIAIINPAGVVRAVSTGITTISYSVTNSCGTAVATASEQVISSPYAGNIVASAASICIGAGITLSDLVQNGIWSSSSTAIAVVDNSGAVNGINPGSVIISYSLSNSCGTNNATKTLTVDPLPYILPITGTTLVPIDGTAGLGDPVAGGAWSSSNTSIATIDPGGTVTGMTLGTSIITYTIVNSFGCSAYDTITITTADINNGTPAPDIKIYPSPAVSILHIEASVRVNVTVLSNDGKLAIKQANAKDIDVRGLANGLYLIMIYDQNNNLLRITKFMKG